MIKRKGWLSIPGDLLFFGIIFAASVPFLRDLINLVLPDLDPFTKFFALILIPSICLLGLRRIVKKGTEGQVVTQ